MPEPAQEWVEAKIKPLSANEMHLGRKVDSAKYRKYTENLKRTKG